MEFRCFVRSCTKVPIFFCSCASRLTYTCPEHIQRHSDELSREDHNIKPIYKKIDANVKGEKIVELQKNLRAVEELQRKMREIFSKMIFEVMKTHKEIQDFLATKENIIRKEIIEIVSKDQELIIPINKKASVLPLSIFSSLADQGYLSSEAICTQLKGLSKTFIASNEDLIQNFTELDDHLYFFRENTTTLVEFSTIDFKMRESMIVGVNKNMNYPGILQVPKIMNHSGIFQGPKNMNCLGICKVPKNKIFVAGDYNEARNICSNGTYLIDLQSKSVESLPRFRNKKNQFSANYYEKLCLYFWRVYV